PFTKPTNSSRNRATLRGHRGRQSPAGSPAVAFPRTTRRRPRCSDSVGTSPSRVHAKACAPTSSYPVSSTHLSAALRPRAARLVRPAACPFAVKRRDGTSLCDGVPPEWETSYITAQQLVVDGGVTTLS